MISKDIEISYNEHLTKDIHKLVHLKWVQYRIYQVNFIGTKLKSSYLQPLIFLHYTSKDVVLLCPGSESMDRLLL